MVLRKRKLPNLRDNILFTDDQLREKLFFHIKVVNMFSELRLRGKPVHDRKRSSDASAEAACRLDICDLLDIIAVDLFENIDYILNTIDRQIIIDLHTGGFSADRRALQSFRLRDTYRTLLLMGERVVVLDLIQK